MTSSRLVPKVDASLWNEVDVLLVRKQSAVERYASRDAKHLESHEQLLRVTERVSDFLSAHGLRSASITLGQLHESPIPYFKPASPGARLQPKASLVIAVGGDGTLLHVSHYLGGDMRLTGINAAPKASVGHLCLARGTGFEAPLAAILEGQQEPTTVERIEAHTISPAVSSLDAGLPLAMNDVLFCNIHPAATSRYELMVYEPNETEDPPGGEETANLNPELGRLLLSESHVSSGVWVSTAAGSTAAISSYGLQRLPLASRRFLVAVREPYFRPGSLSTLTRASLDGASQALLLRSRMERALVAVDGHDFCVQIDRGQAVFLRMRPESRLKIFV